LIPERRENIFTRTVITLVVIIITVMRKPELLTTPRFYAEEGQSFFSYAYNHTLIDYILTPMYGYYALYNIIATYLATMPRLDMAPLATTYLAFITQIAVSFYAIYGNIPILNSDIKRLLAAISFPLLCPSQVWLTTIGVQYWLCIMTLLILLEGYDSRVKAAHVVKAIVLILTGLTGVLSCFMAPVFVFKWMKTRSKPIMLYSCVLCACLIIQVCVFITALMHHDSSLHNRFVDRGFSVIQMIYMHTVLLFSKFFITEHTMDIPFINMTDTHLTETMNRYACGIHMFEKYETTYFILTALLLLTIALLLLKHNYAIDYISIILSFIIIYALSITLSIDSSGGHRYRFAPMCMLMVFFIASYRTTALAEIHNLFLATIICLIIGSQSVDFMHSMHFVYNDNWPHWNEEVRLWHQNKDHHLKIWPPPWEVVLNKHLNP